MIESTSTPADLSTWGPEIQPFYLELYGETQPRVDESFAEVVHASGTTPEQVADAAVYEYWWTLGHPGAPEFRRHWFDRSEGKPAPWQDLADPAARIYLYFPISAGWRAQEVTATLKYLSPMAEQRDWLQTAAHGFQTAQPLIADASQVAGLVPGGAIASKWLETVSKLQISSLPQTGDLKWSVGKVTFGKQDGVRQGVMWTLPRAVFQRLGGRITGSLAVSFVPSQQQHAGAPADTPVYHPADLMAHAVVYSADDSAPDTGHRRATMATHSCTSASILNHRRARPTRSQRKDLRRWHRCDLVRGRMAPPVAGDDQPRHRVCVRRAGSAYVVDRRRS